MQTASQKISADFFGSGSVLKILLKIAPPVMAAQLIQSLYNIVDSFFVGRYSADGLTALSVIFPVQCLIVAIAVGTGTGVNILMTRQYAQGKNKDADSAGGTGIFLALLSWIFLSILAELFMESFVSVSAKSKEAMYYALLYGKIVTIGSAGIFLESIFTKIHQAQGNMKLPMIAQIAGAVTNTVLDPILIFGFGIIPELGIAGAAFATVAGQVVAAVITGVSGFRKIPPLKNIKMFLLPIYKFGLPSIFMQFMYVVYIMILNMILAGFSDSAVTVLGLYYKLQTFFFIPLFAFQTCIVPVLSYNYARKSFNRCRKIVFDSILIAFVLMLAGVLCFELIPGSLIRIFSDSTEVLHDGIPAFRIIGASFFPCVFSLMSPVVFQAVGDMKRSLLLSVIRQIFCLIPIFWILSFLGLVYTWIAFPSAEIITGTVGMLMYRNEIKRWKRLEVNEV